jgi:hypothetical protein
MSTELVKVNTLESLEQGGAGLDFSKKLFNLKPDTLTICQGQTQAVGAIPGKLRLVSSGDLFSKMTVVLLDMPKEQRKWYIGEKGTLKNVPENLMCYSFDMLRPDEGAKMPQALKCEGCAKSLWIDGNPPDCDPYYYALLIDTITKIPMRMYIRGASRKPFEASMQTLARKFKLLQSQGLKPNIFDMSFDISTKKHINKAKQTSYVIDIDGQSFHLLKEEEKSQFGELYLNYVNRGIQEPDEQDYVEETAKTVDTAVAGTSETVNAQGEVVI